MSKYEEMYQEIKSLNRQIDCLFELLEKSKGVTSNNLESLLEGFKEELLDSNFEKHKLSEKILNLHRLLEKNFLECQDLYHQNNNLKEENEYLISENEHLKMDINILKDEYQELSFKIKSLEK